MHDKLIKNQKIAVVDDDYTARVLITEFLEDEGYEVISVENPKNIGHHIEDCSVIIMDVRIEFDRYAGLDYILEQQKNQKIDPSTRIIFISNFGYDTQEMRTRLQEVGKYTWLDKPLEMTELRRILKSRETNEL